MSVEVGPEAVDEPDIGRQSPSGAHLQFVSTEANQAGGYLIVDEGVLVEAVWPAAMAEEPAPESPPTPRPAARVAGEAAVSQSSEGNPFSIWPPHIVIPKIDSDESGQPAAAEAKKQAVCNMNAALETTLHWVRREGVLSREELAVVPLPEELAGLGAVERALVIAAAGALTDRPLPRLGREAIARQLRRGPNVASLVVAAHELADPPTAGRGRIRTLRETAGELRAPKLDSGTAELAKAVDATIFAAYKVHAAGAPARMLLFGMAARQVGQTIDNDPTLEVAVAKSFRSLYESVRAQLGGLSQFPEAVFKPLQSLRSGIVDLGTLLTNDRITDGGHAKAVQRVVQTYASRLDEQEAATQAKEHAKRVWEANQAQLPVHERAQGEYHNALVVLPPSQLARMAVYGHRSLTRVGERIDKLNRTAVGTMSEAAYEAALERLEYQKDVLSRAVAGAGMALLEQSFGARVEDERAIRLALEETRDHRLVREVEKIEAAKLYDRLALRIILPIALSSSVSRADEIAAGYITAADALLATMVDAERSWVEGDEVVTLPPEIQNPLRVLQDIPANERSKRGTFIRGVFQHNHYHRIATGKRGKVGPDAQTQIAARFYESWAGVQEVMRLIYVDELLEHGAGGISREMSLRRQAWVADVADLAKGDRTNQHGLTGGARIRLESSRKAQQDLRRYNGQIDKMLRPYVKRVATVGAKVGRAAWEANATQRTKRWH